MQTLYVYMNESNLEISWGWNVPFDNFKHFFTYQG